MAVSELILHVGFQQTGARMLRRALTGLRPQLARCGVGLVTQQALENVNGVDGWRCDGAADPAAAPAFARGVAELVEGEARAVSGSGRGARVVVSSDHLLGRRNVGRHDEGQFRPFAVPSLAQVAAAVGAPAVRVLLYVRRQDRLMEACHLRALQNGGTQRFEQHFPRRTEPLLDYGELIERLEGVPAVDVVRVRPFELAASSAPAYAHDFLSALGLADDVDLAGVGADSPPYRLYSRRAAAIALDVNRHLDSQRERRLVRDFLIEQLPGADDDSTRLLPADERQAVLDAYAAVNRRLFERWMGDLDPDGYTSDEATSRLPAAAAPASERTGASRPRLGLRTRRRLRAAGVRLPAASGRQAADPPGPMGSA